ncbi:putative exosome complex component RRP40 [Gregarina niphandrodes]|uniref:Exosome complex component RRP40 n=1 Tax=Gregarina niphandrodes TaxID=110365 RepID=A0A023B2V4_GRENI|nr:putative exosome complex component RRP40 [Gregarina niphandrodes]EZG55185.1 putative exosome complex component RRP40 [Gregarina niphandrodes]|eukprot:XP_011131712.1 putative exosome complex component RRP40 [Gregarina niphandrodes]
MVLLPGDVPGLRFACTAPFEDGNYLYVNAYRTTVWSPNAGSNPSNVASSVGASGRVRQDRLRLDRAAVYLPKLGEVVVGQVTKRLPEFYKVDIGASKEALLSVTAFNGATKQNAPNLEVGDAVIAGVCVAHTHHELLLTCVVANEPKTWSSRECYLGPLGNTGLLFRVPLHHAQILIATDCSLLHLIGQIKPFEIATGINGL